MDGKKISGIVLTTDAHQIFYDHYLMGHKKIIVIAHGFFNSKKSVLIEEFITFLGADFDVIVFDFRGHGESDGLFSWTVKETLDLKAVLKYTGRKYKQIGLIGFSLGAAVSIIVLSESNAVNSFVSVSAPVEFKKIDYNFWNLDLEQDIYYNLTKGKKGKGVRPGPFWLKKKKPIKVVNKLTIPVLYIHGEDDWVIRPYHS
ncbi:MAG: hypothetical protein DRP78_01475, partial [Candidatus Omnitrophota bacterium]